jgi:glycosyltransferase involved in cell wall biosynthesis
MVRVLSVVPMPYVSGLQNMVLGFCNKFSGDIEQHFLLTRWSDGAFAKRLDEMAISYSYSWLGFFSRSLEPENLKMTLHGFSKVPRLYYDYAHLVKTFNPDLIYMANYHELLLLWPMLHLLCRPVVCHMADPAPSQPFYQSVARMYDPLVTRYVAISQSVRERLVALGIDQSKIELLHPGIDLTQMLYRRPRTTLFTRRQNWPKDVVIIGMSGQMIMEKGHEDLIDAARLICAEIPQAHIVIGGKPVQPLFSELQARVQTYRIEDRVAFVGWQPDISDFCAAIDIAVMPSRQEEGFGLVAAEALATGVPVVATRSGGLLDIIQHGVNGLLVEKGQPIQLANALRLLVQSPDLRRHMGRCGRQRVEETFDIGKQVQRLEQTLQQVGALHKYGRRFIADVPK